MSEQTHQEEYLSWTTITNDTAYQEWMETLKPSTELGYRSGILSICRFYKCKPSDLKTWDSSTANDQLRQFILYLKKNAKPYGGKKRKDEFSVNSIPTYFYAIINFFEHFDIDIRTKKIAKIMPEMVESDLRPYKREEIVKVLALAKPREKMIILVPEACGAREGGLAEFEVKHISIVNQLDWTLKPLHECIVGKSIPITPGTIGIIKVYGNSKKAKYISFVTYEALKSITEYLEYRMLHFEPIVPSTPIVRDYFVPLGKNVKNPKKLSGHRINRIVQTLLDRAGLPREELQPLHGLRKFFNTVAKNSGIDYMYKEGFMGHSINLDRIYYDPEIPQSLEKMVTEYSKAIDSLTIDDANRLRRKVEVLQVKADRIDEVLQWMDSVKAKEHI